MTSLLTNSAAMVALRTLNQINSSLDTTNNRVSTGLRISEAKDSAAYWAIATTTASDNSALGSVHDALALGKSTLDVVYNGLQTTRESLQKLKDLLVAARQGGIDRTKIQTQINGLITDMVNKAGASVINEQNYLSVDKSAASYNATKSIVASFERSASGITVSTVDLDITNIILVDTRASGAKGGLLDKVRAGITAVNTEDGTAGTTPVVVNGILALKTYDTEDNDATTLASPIGDLTDSAADLTKLDNFLKGVELVMDDVITAQNTIGVNQARAESQTKFIAALMDANKASVGALVDADMEEESTKLRALQTQQQLSVQSLSIANTASQNVLSLFR